MTFFLAGKWIACFFAADVLLALTYMGTRWLLPASTAFNRLWNLDREANIATWYSSSQLLLIGLLWLPIVGFKTRWARPLTWSLIGVPALFLFCSMTEVAQIHEYLVPRLDVFLGYGASNDHHELKEYAWRTLLVWIPIGIAIVGIVRMAWKNRGLPAAYFPPFIVGLAIMFGSGTGLEILRDVVPPTRWWHIAQVASEELGEMLGATLLLWTSIKILAHLSRFQSPDGVSPGKTAHELVSRT